MKNENATTLIKEMLAKQAKAIQDRKVAEATQNYAPDAFIFDVVGPLSYPKGSASVKERLEQWFSSFAEGSSLRFELVNLSVSAEETLGFSHSLNHVSAALKKGGALDMYWRETLNWEKEERNGRSSTLIARYLFDPATGKASTGLKP